ncbi:MAG: DUF3880 domain-containing protein [Lachnospira sp.]|nr:DUF3880 domain-containing protein [Lachnospira sp.]
MNILYYSWNEVMAQDITDTLKDMGNTVNIADYPMKDYLKDASFIEKMEIDIDKNNYDCIITCNYVPLISKVSLRKKLPYIAWISDSPCLTVYSEMIFNPYNFVFHFDNDEVVKLKNMGVTNIYHMPLAVNTKRVLKKVKTNNCKCNKDVTFLGNLYSQDANSVFKINGMSDYQKGYIQAIIDAQLRIMGSDIIEGSVTDDFIKDLLRIVDIQIDDELMFNRKDIILNMIRKEATIVERKELIDLLSSNFKVDLYTPSDVSRLNNINVHGYADYYNEMPVIFNSSRINLNITLRSILSGISLRNLDVMGAGGFLLSNYQNELARYFEEGKEMVMYYDRQDLINKINYYLVHDEKRIEIAKAGQKKILENFDYSMAWEEIFATVFGR